MSMTRKKIGLGNLVLNIVVPSIILIKFSASDQLGPVLALVIALLFPILYGLFDFVRSRKFNIFSAIGLISILLTGGIGLFELPVGWLALKEAAIPLALGVAVIVTMSSRYALVPLILGTILDLDNVVSQLSSTSAKDKMRSVMRWTTILVAASFFTSAILNYTLVKWIVISPPGTEAFNAELGKMTALSFPIIALPSTLILTIGLVFFLMQLSRLSGRPLEDLLQITSVR